MDIFQQILNNKYFVGFVTVGTVLYASLARPSLPQWVANLFEHRITKMIFYALIVFLLTQNLQVALVVAIAFYILMSMLREQRIAEGFIEGLQTEGFLNKQIGEIEAFYQETDGQNTPSSGQNKGDMVVPTSQTPNLQGQNSLGQIPEDHEKILGRCVDHCLNQNRNNRPETRQEFSQRLENCLRQERETYARPTGQANLYGQNQLPYQGQYTGSSQGTNYGQMQGQSTGNPPYGQNPTTSYGQNPTTSYGQTTNTSYGQPPNTSYGQTTNTSYGQPTNTSYGQPTNTFYG